jgi:hypothetical protein
MATASTCPYCVIEQWSMGSPQQGFRRAPYFNRYTENCHGSVGQPIGVLTAINEEEIRLAFETLAQGKTRALLVISER